MSRESQAAKPEAERRSELGGYSDAEFESALARSQSSDVFSVGARALTLVAVFWLLAHAIQVHDLPAWLLILPLVVEFIAIFWIGFVLSRFIVDCPTFAKSAGSLGLLLTWTVASLIVLFAVAGIDPELHGWRWQHIGTGVQILWFSLAKLGLHWVIFVSLSGLLISTSIEVLRWRRLRGVFVWTSIMNTGFRLGVMLLLGIVGFVAVLLLDNAFYFSLADLSAKELAWAVFAFLLVGEVLTLIVSTLMHREALSKQGSRPMDGA